MTMHSGMHLGTQLRSELRKTTSTRLWWVLILIMALGSAGITAMVVCAGLNAPLSPLRFATADGVVPAYNIATGLAYVFPLAAGAIVVTQEHRSRTIAATLLAEPRRARVYGAKMLVGLSVALAYGIASAASGALVAAALLARQGHATFLSTGTVLAALGGSVVALTLWGAIGVGVGALVRSQTPAIVGILLVTQFLEPALRILSASLGGPALGSLLPGGAGDLAAGGTIMAAATGTAGGTPALGLLVLSLYALALGALGAIRFTRYEVT